MKDRHLMDMWFYFEINEERREIGITEFVEYRRQTEIIWTHGT